MGRAYLELEEENMAITVRGWLKEYLQQHSRDAEAAKVTRRGNMVIAPAKVGKLFDKACAATGATRIRERAA